MADRSLQEILSLNPSLDWENIEADYLPKKPIEGFEQSKEIDIAEFWLDSEKFTNYGQYQFIWEKTYSKSPSRSIDGSMASINSLTTFLTPHLVINFSMMSIDDYRRLMKKHYEKNEFVVRCYDPIYNNICTAKMYFATEQMAKLYTISRKRMTEDGWEDFLMLAGVSEYTVELIGTNNKLDTLSVIYKYVNPHNWGTESPSHPKIGNNYIYPSGDPITDQAEEDIYPNTFLQVGGASTFKDNPPNQRYKFSHWVDNSGGYYKDGETILVSSPKTFYAVWTSKKDSTLSFDFGVATPSPVYNPDTGVLESSYSKSVRKGSEIGSLPSYNPPKVTIGEKDYMPYNEATAGWYKTPVKKEENRVYSDTKYWSDYDQTIYLLFDKIKYNIVINPNFAEYSPLSQKAEYAEVIPLPSLYREGYTHKGYKVGTTEKVVYDSFQMTPYDITLTAVWEKNS